MKPSTSRSALRPFELLEAFRAAGRPLSLSEMSQLAKIPMSTCHSVVKSLEKNGFLYFVSPREAYPTRRLLDIANEINKNDPITTKLSPRLNTLRDRTGETVILGIRQGDQAVYLLIAESNQTIRYSSSAGEFKPLHSSSIGKALLGSMEPARAEEWIASRQLERITDRTITEPQALLRDLGKSRARGYYVTQGENVPDVMAIAAPFMLGTTCFAVALAGPLSRVARNEAALAAQLKDCVASLENGDIYVSKSGPQG